MESVSAIAVSTIAQFAFTEFIKLGAGELAKQLLESAIDRAKRLRDKIQTLTSVATGAISLGISYCRSGLRS